MNGNVHTHTHQTRHSCAARRRMESATPLQPRAVGLAVLPPMPPKATPAPKAATTSVTGKKRQLEPKAPSAPVPDPALLAELKCPISLELPVDPVTAEDGRVYERLKLLEYFSLTDAPQGEVARDGRNHGQDGRRGLPDAQHDRAARREQGDRWAGGGPVEARQRGLQDPQPRVQGDRGEGPPGRRQGDAGRGRRLQGGATTVPMRTTRRRTSGSSRRPCKTRLRRRRTARSC